MLKIEIEANKVWDLFQEKKGKLFTDLQEIATDPDINVVVYLTAVGESGEIQPDIIVCVNDDAFYEESCWDKQDCEEVVSSIYNKVTKMAHTKEEDSITEEELQDLEIEAREDEIDASLYDFLSVVLDNNIDEYGKAREKDFFVDCKEHFLEFLALKWGSDIRRPMYLEDLDGTEKYEEYPYDLIDFDDADDPIYFFA